MVLFCFWLRTALLKRENRTGLDLEQGGDTYEAVDKRNGPRRMMESKGYAKQEVVQTVDMGGKPTVTSRQCIRGKLQELPVAMPAVTGGSWQDADFAKL